MKKTFRKIHLWLSVPFGIFITLICFSGAMLVFEKEITEALHHDLYYVNEVKEQPLPLDSLMKAVTATLPDSVEVTGVTISPDRERAYQVSLSKPRRASIYVDQYTGEVKGRSGRLPFYDTMFHMHRWMMGSSQGFGKLLVGVSTLMLVIILITGILMWLSNRKKPLTKSLTISFTKGWPRFWHDLHVAGGIYTTVFLLALALTGLTWSFSWYRTGFYAMFGVEASAGGHGGGHGKESHGKEKRGDGGRQDGRHKNDGHDGMRDGRRGGGEGRRHRGDGEHSRRDNMADDGRKKRSGDSEAHNQDDKTVASAGDMAEQRMEGDGEKHRGRRGGRYHHAQDSTGTYTGRHNGDSLRHRHGNRDMADGERYAARDDNAVILSGEEKELADNNIPASAKKESSRKHENDRARRGGKNRNARAFDNGNVISGDSLTDKVSEDHRDSLDSVQVKPVSPFTHWQTVYDNIAKAHPGFRQITISEGSASVVPAGRNSLRSGDRFDFDTETGKITGSKPYSEQEKSSHVRSGVYTVHTGSWGGLLTRIITFLAALLGATLPLTGYYLWIRRLFNKSKHGHNHHA